MKTRYMISVLLLLNICSTGMARTGSDQLDQFIGDWQGEGYFYNVNLGSEVGSVRFSLRVSPQMEITGSVGDAVFRDAEFKVDDWNAGYMIKGTVVGQIFPNSNFHKKRITLLLKDVQNDVTTGEFHFSNNFIFDIRVRPGAITLRRNP